jgi:hypothetical protein
MELVKLGEWTIDEAVERLQGNPTILNLWLEWAEAKRGLPTHLFSTYRWFTIPTPSEAPSASVRTEDSPPAPTQVEASDHSQGSKDSPRRAYSMSSSSTMANTSSSGSSVRTRNAPYIKPPGQSRVSFPQSKAQRRSSFRLSYRAEVSGAFSRDPSDVSPPQSHPPLSTVHSDPTSPGSPQGQATAATAATASIAPDVAALVHDLDLSYFERTPSLLIPGGTASTVLSSTGEMARPTDKSASSESTNAQSKPAAVEGLDLDLSYFDMTPSVSYAVFKAPQPLSSSNSAPVPLISPTGSFVSTPQRDSQRAHSIASHFSPAHASMTPKSHVSSTHSTPLTAATPPHPASTPSSNPAFPPPSLTPQAADTTTTTSATNQTSGSKEIKGDEVGPYLLSRFIACYTAPQSAPAHLPCYHTSWTEDAITLVKRCVCAAVWYECCLESRFSFFG